MTRYVAYFRVSTASQGRSGLGLGAQKAHVLEFVGPSDEIVAEYVEVQSGRSDTRTELWKAIATAKRHSAKIVIAKLDRFSRKVSFIAGIMEQGVGLAVADMPNATDFQLHIFAALAQEERRMISERTRRALAEAKRRGVQLGKNGRVLAERHHAEAIERANKLAPFIRSVWTDCQSFSATAKKLNDLGVRTMNGRCFHPQTVKNIIIKLQWRGE